METKNQKKIIYIPGWMDRASFYPRFKGLEIWEQKISPEDKIEADYIVAHSLGTHFALLNWQIHQNTKLILVNPPLFLEKFRRRMWEWVKFFFGEGIKHINPGRVVSFFRIFSIWAWTRQLLSIDFTKILDTVPKENVTIIRGKKDFFFCTEAVGEYVKSNNFNLIEIEGMGHAFDARAYEIIEKIVKEN